MEKYWEGGVAALLSKGKDSNLANINNKIVNSKKRSPKDNSRTVSDNDLVKPSFVINNKKDMKTVKKKKLSDVNDNKMSTDIENVTSKKMKYVSDKCNTVENDTVNTLPNERKEQKKIKRKESSSEYQKSNNADVSQISKNISFEENNIKSLKKKNTNTNTNFDKRNCTVFVGNLPLSYDHKKVVKIFSKFGKVESARIRCVPVASAKIKKKTSAITKKFHPNRNSAVAYVVFKSKDSVDNAIAENGMILNGHHLRIDSCVSKKKDSNKSVFVGGLPFDIEDDELWDLFKDCGDIEGVRIIRDGKVSMGKGFGYVNFKSSASVELALQLNGQELKNRKINVQRCIDKKKNSNHKNSVVYDKKKKNEKWQTTIHRKKSKQKSSTLDFQGRKCEKKQKKKKNTLTKDAIRKKQIKSVLSSASQKSHGM